jgi:hypothetical protein
MCYSVLSRLEIFSDRNGFPLNPASALYRFYNYLPFIELEDLLLNSHELATGSYPEPDELIPHPHTPVPYDPV